MAYACIENIIYLFFYKMECTILEISTFIANKNNNEDTIKSNLNNSKLRISII